MNRAEAAAIARASQVVPLEQRFWSKVDRRGAGECWPWLRAVRKKSQGYGAFRYEGRNQPASRIAWLLTNGSVPAPGLEILHRCDNPPCCNPDHLFLGTTQENTADKVAKGRQARGSANGASRLSEQDINEIRNAMSGDLRQHRGIRGALAAKFGVTPQYISEIRGRKSWKHV